MPAVKEVRGSILERKSGWRIYEGFPYNIYDVSPPSMSEREKYYADLLVKVITRESSLNALAAELGSKNKAVLEQFRSTIIQTIDMNKLVYVLPSPKQMEILKIGLLPVAEALLIENKKQFIEYVLETSIGFGEMAPLMKNPQLEEIMVNGYERNVFVFHRKFGNCKTNLVITDQAVVFKLITRAAASVNKKFNEAHPLLDARLPDGSRANATFNYVSPLGHTLTIRRFSKIPLSIIDLIANETMSSEIAAFLWTMTEGLGFHPMNMIITGGTGSGKTTLMNILASFIPFEERIISIEDTLELDLGMRENWIQMESKPALKDLMAISMDDLLKNTLRMRPDRILVGEVRSEEARTLYVAMDTGHRGILGTLHSNSAREMMLRLKSKPMSVPEQMLPLLDMVVVMQRRYDKREGIIRRIKHITEVSRMEEKVLLSNVYEWSEKTQKTSRSDVPCRLIEELAKRSGMTKRELKSEIQVRKKILEYMLQHGIRKRSSVEAQIQEYYFNPEEVLRKIVPTIE